MYTSVLRMLSGVLLLSAAVNVYAQNIDTNPGFDTGIEGWTPFGNVVWAPSVGYTGPSIHLDTQASASMATQCLWAEGGQSFVASARVYAHCPGARLYVFWSSNLACSDTGAFPDYFAVSSTADEWEPLTVAVPAQDGAFVIELMLYNGGGCRDGVYFDDVTLQFDDIFNEGFEVRGIE